MEYSGFGQGHGLIPIPRQKGDGPSFPWKRVPAGKGKGRTPGKGAIQERT
jgi:hypothetical protein